MARIKHGTLVAATVATVTLTVDCRDVEVLNRTGDAEIFFTVDGSTPTVAGDNTHVLPAQIGSLIVAVPETGNTVVKLISSGTPSYAVEGIGTQ